MTHGTLWPYIFIAVAGILATQMWRWLGVVAGKRLTEESEALTWVKATATALVAAVIAKHVFYPSGILAESLVSLRVVAAIFGFAIFLAFGKRMALGIAAALAFLGFGLYWTGF